MKKEIIIASGNKGKIEQIKSILTNYEIISINEINPDIDVVEDGKTFEENARKKAFEFSKLLNGKLCLADDSGIEVESLDGFPGVITKRWFTGTDRQRNLALIEKLEGFPKEKRKVTFTSSVAISNGEKTIVENNILSGYISNEPRGENGFGFDEIFELENGKTLAEISLEEKNKIGIRANAIKKLKERLEKGEI